EGGGALGVGGGGCCWSIRSARIEGLKRKFKSEIKEGIDGEVATMVMDSYLIPNLSWKDKLLGGGAVIFGMACNDPSEGSESDFELLKGDVSTTMVNGISAIVFSDILTPGPWIIYGQYLTVQPWTKDFTSSQPYPSVVMARTLLSKLSRFMLWSTASSNAWNMRRFQQYVFLTHSQRDLRDNDAVKTRKEPLGSRFMALNAVGEMGNGNGEADEGISRGNDKENVNKALGGNKAKVKEMPKEGLSFSNGAGRGGSAGLKSSMGPAKPTSFGLAQDNSTGDGLDFEVDDQGDMDSEVQENINFGNFEENKAHYNPTFEELEGIGVLITDGVFDPGKHLANLRISIAKFMEAVMDLLSSKGCASVKFPRVYQEYNMEYKYDIISLLEPRASGFRGPPFTWHRGALFERLDRALGNEAWVHNFPSNLITYLPKVKSHHKPLLLSLNLEVILPRGVGECTASRRTPLEIKRQDVTGFNLGGRNTKFFHTCTLRKRKNSRITAIHNSDSDWIYDSESIESKANDFFQNLYGKVSGSMGSLPLSSFPQLDPIDIDFLGKPVTSDEIK
ncbi:hypothetical protein Goarm_020281, partial [Gossypium armourianum]|nr:hypothetical protein [Gossypium armourianum]